MFTFENVIRSGTIIVLLSTTAFSVSNIRETKHNLSIKIINNNNSDVSDDELCIYCHTPNGSQNGFSTQPLWNKTVTLKTFTIYSMSNVESDSTSGSSFMACLSCHDGINAINVLTNTSTGGSASPSGSIPSGIGLSLSGKGEELSKAKNHPISVTYNSGTAGLKMTGTPLVGWAGAKTIDSLLRNNKVECGSCHDPHESTNGTFLRVSNGWGELCRGCHAK